MPDKYGDIVKRAGLLYLKTEEGTRGLYSRHSLNFDMPKATAPATRDVDALRESIAEDSGLDFDLFNFSSESEFVKIIKNKKIARKKVYESFESELIDCVSGAPESIVVDIPAGKEAELNLLFACGKGTLPLGVVINAGKGSRLRILELYGSLPAANTVLASQTVHAEEGSNIEIDMIHNEAKTTAVGGVLKAIAESRSQLKLNAAYAGGGVSKFTNFADALGPESCIGISEIVSGKDEQRFDMKSMITNTGRATRAELASGAMLNDASFCMLKGYACIEACASNSVSKVEERGLLLGGEAKLQQLPEMSVECNGIWSASHSASVAPIDEEQMFYLMSRGLSRERARQALVSGFAAKHLSGIASDKVKDIATAVIFGNRLGEKHET